MFFKFNPFQSRISASSQSSAYTPQGVSPYAGRQQPIMFGFKKTATPSAQTAAKSTTTGAMSQTVNIPLSNADGGVHGEVPISPKYRRFMELQQYFMKDDGKMVWQKMKRDRPLYLLSMALCITGTCTMFYTFYDMEQPIKKDE